MKTRVMRTLRCLGAKPLCSSGEEPSGKQHTGAATDEYDDEQRRAPDVWRVAPPCACSVAAASARKTTTLTNVSTWHGKSQLNSCWCLFGYVRFGVVTTTLLLFRGACDGCVASSEVCTLRATSALLSFLQVSFTGLTTHRKLLTWRAR
jgi:hypothetical protein